MDRRVLVIAILFLLATGVSILSPLASAEENITTSTPAITSTTTAPTLNSTTASITSTTATSSLNSSTSPPKSNTTSTTKMKTTTTTSMPLIYLPGSSGNGRGRSSLAIPLVSVMFAILVIYLLYLKYLPRIRASSPGLSSKAKYVEIEIPKRADFVAYVTDPAERTIRLESFLKISENLYMGTNISKPTFLYVPDNVEVYQCKIGRKASFPCGLAHREGLLAILVDPRLAGAHELAQVTGIINAEESELDKLLSKLYMQGETKFGVVPIAPDTGFGITLNLRKMTKGYLSVLRSADEMMMHFLHTASQAESIQDFVKASIRLQRARFSWLKWVAILIMSVALAIGIVEMFAGGG